MLKIQQAKAEVYNGTPQLRLEEYIRLSTDEAAILPREWFCAKSARNSSEMWVELTTIIEQHMTPRWTALAKSVFANPSLKAAFMTSAAAKEVHHAYAHGLLEHSLGVVRLALKMGECYHFLNLDLLIAGALFHDLGKIQTYEQTLQISVTDAGKLIGHAVLGVLMLEPYLVKSELTVEEQLQLKHLILSHHGQPEFGACQLPMTSEAIVLHFIDDIDAKMAICVKALQNVPTGEWTHPIFALDKRSLLAAPLIPQSVTESEGKKNRGKRAKPKEGEEDCFALLRVSMDQERPRS